MPCRGLGVRGGGGGMGRNLWLEQRRGMEVGHRFSLGLGQIYTVRDGKDKT